MKKQSTSNALGKNATNTLQDNEKFYSKALELKETSRYAKDKRLTLQDVKKFVDASLEVLTDKNINDKIVKLYAINKDINTKSKTSSYKRIQRVFSSIVASKLKLSTSTTHEKITESVNKENRQLVRSFFSYTNEQLDTIEKLVYKYKISK